MTSSPTLVLGASGRTGRVVVRKLLERGLPVRALVRDPERFQAMIAPESPGLQLLPGMVTHPGTLEIALMGCAGVISALGVPGPGASPELIEIIEHTLIAQLGALAATRGLDRVVLCSSLGTETPEALPALAPVLRAKRRGELALMQRFGDAVILRPGGLHDGPGGQGLRCARKLPGFGRVSREDTAEVLVLALLSRHARGPYELVEDASFGPASREDLFSK